MNRREFLAASGLAAAFIASQRAEATGTQHARVTVDAQRRLGKIPADFIGLGYEISSVTIPHLLAASDRTYVQLVRTLSPAGVVRIGGNTSDDSSFSADGQAVSAPKGTVVNAASLQQLGMFLEATNWKLIWGLNLGTTDEQQAVAEAEAVSHAAKHKLLAFEIGNETDLLRHNPAHRPPGYDYDAFLKDYRRYQSAIRAKLPQAAFAGPDVASATDWVTRFASDEGGDLKLLTHHYYRQCVGKTSTLDKLLNPDPKLAPELEALKSASAKANVPYRICETNSFCGGGQPGVSDTFGAALWVLDFMFTLASNGCAGVNIETGVNQLGFISSYSPINQRANGDYFAAAPYYGMLAFAKASHGEALGVDCDSAGVNLAAYAVEDEQRGLAVTLINKDVSTEAEVNLVIPKNLKAARVFRLSAPSLQSKEGITFAGSAVTESGEWTVAAGAQQIHSRSGECDIRMPAGSAAILKWT